MPRELEEEEVRDFTSDQEEPVTQWIMDAAEFDQFVSESREIIVLKKNKLALEKREAVLKTSLLKIIERLGIPYGSEGQHLAIDLPTPIEGIAKMVRQTRVSTGVNESMAEDIARQKGIYKRLFKPVMQLDEGAVWAAREQGLITDAEMEQMFPKKRVYSLVPEKAK